MKRFFADFKDFHFLRESNFLSPKLNFSNVSFKHSCFVFRTTPEGFSFLHAFISSDVFRCFHFCCCCTASATDLREHFFILRCFLPYTSSQHLAQPAFIKSSLELAAQPWRLQSLPLRFETQTQGIYLFESHSVQQKVLVGRFYSYAWVSSWYTNQTLTGFKPVF